MEAITINTEKLFDLDNINSFAKEWKEAAIGNKVLAYYCSHMPEEILYAADILPYRLSGTGVTDDSQAETYLSPFSYSLPQGRCRLQIHRKQPQARIPVPAQGSQERARSRRSCKVSHQFQQDRRAHVPHRQHAQAGSLPAGRTPSRSQRHGHLLHGQPVHARLCSETV